MMEHDPNKKAPYYIELVEGGSYGDWWHIICPGGGCLDTGWVDKDSAQDWANKLNKAFEIGRTTTQSENRNARGRYAWLRKHSWLDMAEFGAPRIVFGQGYRQDAPEKLDAAIDRARECE